MGSTQRGHGSDDEMFDALDFGDNPGSDSGAVPDFGDDNGQGDGAVPHFGEERGRDDVDQSAFEVMVTDEAPDPADVESGLGATVPDIEEADTAEQEFAKTLATVTNPPETVSVTAMMDGRIYQVELSADAARMTEPGLAEEILVIADLARRQALSIQHKLMFESFHLLGADDDDALAEMLENSVMELSSPQQAAQAQAEVFATRYRDDGGAPGL
ncbi:ESX-1 secretion-associated protein EspH [Mycobacterium lentiflavum]|uniref:ESX-1 secretion-associated protein EspH n=1 Tax=Mycobacterium lentiflavum TaxID=141349 RepID=A0A0E4GZC6_MYCLN|nr:hypothetical protein [Mycobacterium lentiflavum]CQD17314.1 ESX-1 secretion-associated protein EspH [Mycobacterium lentiflavum]